MAELVEKVANAAGLREEPKVKSKAAELARLTTIRLGGATNSVVRVLTGLLFLFPSIPLLVLPHNPNPTISLSLEYNTTVTSSLVEFDTNTRYITSEPLPPSIPSFPFPERQTYNSQRKKARENLFFFTCQGSHIIGDPA